MTIGNPTTWWRNLPSRWRQSVQRGSELHTVLSNSGWLMADRLLRMALAVLVGAWVARHLGPSGYGELAYGIALVAVWQALATLGLDSVLVRDLAREPVERHRLLGSALRLRLVGGLAGWIGTAVCAAVLRPGDDTALLIAVVLGAGLLFQASDIVDLWFQSQSRSKATVVPRLMTYCFASLVRIGLILTDAPLGLFAAAVLLEGALAALALRIAYRTHPTSAAWQWDRDRAVAMLRESWPFMLAGLSVIVYARIDQIVLRALSSQHELGLYSAILPFSQAWQIIPMTLCASALPRISLLRDQDPERYRHRLLQLFSAMLWLGLLVASVTAIAAPWLVGRLLGADYEGSVTALRWHACSNVFVFLGVAQSVAIVSDRTSRIALIRTLFGAAVSVSMNLALVPRWGAVGAAWSAIVACFCAAVLSNAWLAPAYLRLQLRALWPFPCTIRSSV